ncbi:MAG: molybdopterin molybdotransferase MoeA [Planctomycetales bacterium]|nr:molybdopterin molybdotransferase MoeA [Planctomycetales bacterium]
MNTMANELESAIERLQSCLAVVDSERCSSANCAGRILADDLLADRDSPASNVSAMDGYAVRMADIQPENRLPVLGTVPAGRPTIRLSAQGAVRVFTGALVPAESEAVLRREDVRELGDAIEIPTDLIRPPCGEHIRLRGENLAAGEVVLRRGTIINSVAMGALACFAEEITNVRRRVRVTILNTGDELVETGRPAEAWQIRDSNGPVLETWLGQLPWVQLLGRRRVVDSAEATEAALREAISRSDAVLLTGGVSMGDADYVPRAIEGMGGQILFHRLPLRPGKPVLGACCQGKLVMGLPGNPVSVTVTSRVFGEPLLRYLAGIIPTSPALPRLSLVNPDQKVLSLTWFRMVRFEERGLTLVENQGSGDLVSLARSNGVIAVPPNTPTDSTPFPFIAW